jgi:mono/diheme cytochrome c family protein
VIRFGFVLSIAVATAGPLCAETPAELEFFEAKVRPLLVERCQKCHGEAKQRGGLRLDSKAAWQLGGDSGRAIVPGKSKESLVVRMVRGGIETPPQMPPDKRLSADEVAILVKWIDAGAADPRQLAAAAPKSKGIDWKSAVEFWSFRPVQAAIPPGPETQSPIDRFISARLREKNLTPVGLADKLTLMRRATFTLTGLPPTRAEVEAFLADASPGAFAHVVDRLLASPRYGEHQARIWLDVARYGEDLNFDDAGKKAIVNAWRYRDWVIDAFNSDLPYDRFVMYQIAADLYDDAEPKHLAALGFFGLGQHYVSNGDPLRARAETLDDRVDTLTRGFLALTVSCARCHDHKFDPIPTIDYYSIAGIFDSSVNADVPLVPKAQAQAYDAAFKIAAEAEKRAKDFVQSEQDRIANEIVDKLPERVVAVWSHLARKLDGNPAVADDAKSVGLDDVTFARLVDYLTRKKSPHPTLASWSKLLPTEKGTQDVPEAVRKVASDFATAVKKNLATPLADRNFELSRDLFGLVDDKGVFAIPYEETLARTTAERIATQKVLDADSKAKKERVPPAPPTAHGIGENKKIADMRVALRGNPYKPGEPAPRRFLRIVAGEERVIFKNGSGRRELAEAIADPKNPLTARVFANRVWQQHFGKGLVATPSNFGKLGEPPTHPELLDWLADRFVSGGWSVKKLHREILLSETFRRADDVVATNHEVDPENRLLCRMNRRRVTVEEYRDSLLAAAGTLDPTLGGKSASNDDLANRRRTVYGKVSRLDPSQMLRLFDFPDANITSDHRSETTVPQQMLFAINSPFATAQAKALAARVEKEAGPEGQVRAAYWFALSRPATEAEVAVGVRYLTAPESTPSTLSRLERFAQALMASNEFVYVD